MPLPVLIHSFVGITIAEIRLPETMTLLRIVSITFVMLKGRNISVTDVGKCWLHWKTFGGSPNLVHFDFGHQGQHDAQTFLNVTR